MKIAPCRTGERELARQHLVQTCRDDLVLYDRGYPAGWLFALHTPMETHFCMRCPWNLYNETRDFVNSGKDEAIVTLSLSKGSLETCQKLGIPADPVTVRLIRVSLTGSDDSEVLITSLLDSERYPARDFADLYHQRWYGEENYKTLKSRLEIENFSGYSVTAIEQDIQSKVVTCNWVNMLAFEAQWIIEEQEKECSFQYAYQVDFANALRKSKDNVVRLLVSANPLELIKKLLEAFAREREPVRPGRSYVRVMNQGKRRFNMQYKRC